MMQVSEVLIPCDVLLFILSDKFLQKLWSNMNSDLCQGFSDLGTNLKNSGGTNT